MNKFTADHFHSFCIHNNKLYATGRNNHGALGVGSDKLCISGWTATKGLPDGIPIIKIGTHVNVTLVLLANGQLYGAGLNEYGLGLDDQIKNVTAFTLIRENVAAMNLSYNHTVLLEQNTGYLLHITGSQYSGLWFKEFTHMNKGLLASTKIKSIVSSCDNDIDILALGNNGIVYTTDNNANGKLGTSKTSIFGGFMQVNGLPSAAAAIYMTRFWSYVLLNDGILYTAEKNMPRLTDEVVPTSFCPTKGLPEGITTELIKSIQATRNFNFILLSDGRLYFSSRDNFLQEHSISNVKAISGFWDHILVLLNDGTIFIHKDNDSGITCFKRVDGLPSTGVISEIYAGVNTSFVATRDGRIFVAGCNRFNQLGLICTPMHGESSPDQFKEVSLPPRSATSPSYSHPSHPAMCSGPMGSQWHGEADCSIQ